MTRTADQLPTQESMRACHRVRKMRQGRDPATNPGPVGMISTRDPALQHTTHQKGR